MGAESNGEVQVAIWFPFPSVAKNGMDRGSRDAGTCMTVHPAQLPKTRATHLPRSTQDLQQP